MDQADWRLVWTTSWKFHLLLHLLVMRILDTGSNSLDQTLIVLLIFILIQNLNLEVALLFFVVCENQAFRSGWVRLPVEVSAGGVRWEDIPEQCSLTWCKLQSQFSMHFGLSSPLSWSIRFANRASHFILILINIFLIWI